MDPIPDFTPDFADSTKVHPLGLAALLVAIGCVLFMRRRYVPATFIAIAALIPSAQRIAVAGLDFNFIRILVVVGVLRALLRGDFLGVRWCAIDGVVMLAMGFKVVGTLVTFGAGPALVGVLGAEFEAVGSYLVLRSALRTPDDLRAVLRCAAIAALVALPFFLAERATGRNLFSVFGGVAAVTDIREGKLRCQGAIAHPILAGCFFAALLPLWIGMWIGARGALRYLLAAACCASVAITVCCASSTPVGAIAQAMIGWAVFPMRAWLRFLWISILASIVLLHLVMKAPVWHLIGRVDFVGGSTGFHRTALIDQAVHRIGEWWLFGTRTTAHWGWGLEDVTNQFVLDGVRGGIGATLCLVLAMALVFCYCGQRIRLARRALRDARGTVAMQVRSDEALAFGVAVAVFMHIGIFLAVSYFGQTVAIWQFVLAAGASLAGWPVLAATASLPGRHSPLRVPGSRARVETRDSTSTPPGADILISRGTP